MARSSPKRVFSNLVLNLLISRSTPGWRRNREELHSLPDHADVPLRLHYHGDLGLPDALRFIYSLLHLLLQVAAHRASGGDRKSTRLNSSHVAISYAVFCLKKKTKTNVITSYEWFNGFVGLVLGVLGGVFALGIFTKRGNEICAYTGFSISAIVHVIFQFLI